jgi:two-component system, NarL family, response regulator YdfI
MRQERPLTLVATAPSTRQIAGAIAVAICAPDRALRARLERLVGGDANLRVVGPVGDPVGLDRLMQKHRVDVAVVQSPAVEQLRRWTRRYRDAAFVAIVGDAPDAGINALRAGAQALLSAAAGDTDIVIIVKATARGLCVLPRDLLGALQTAGPIADDPPRSAGAGEGPLTSRELEVLAAMADGASNKAIARRLGISFHTVKFHVAAILAKLDADSRTEAVTKAAQLGLVML